MKRSRHKRRPFVVLLAVIIFFAGSTFEVHATQSRVQNFNTPEAVSADPGEYVAAIAYAQVGRSRSSLGYTEDWCADFAGDCAAYANQSAAIPVNGSVQALYDAVISAGGYVVSTPRPGDLWFGDWNGWDPMGHVEIVYSVSEDGVSSVGGNGPLPSGESGVRFHPTSGFAYVALYVRPNYTVNALGMSYLPFADVSGAAWYYDTVNWAYTQKITVGTSAAAFEPGKTCTRAEFVAFLYKFMGKPWNPSWTSECSFSDVKTDDWYYRAVVWADHAGITHGTGNGKFSPDVTMDRGMVIAFLYNLEKYQNGNPKITLKDTKFTDVSSEKYYYRPALWAEQYRITNGTSATTFSPEQKCTRAEAVTFLYNFNQYRNR